MRQLRKSGGSGAIGSLFLLALWCAPARAQEADAAAFSQVLSAVRGPGHVTAKFVREHKVLNFDMPLLSSGGFWAASAREGGGERISADWPYRSEYVFVDGKSKAKSQHEAAWTVMDQSSKPGLTAVLVQMGVWSMGGVGRGDWFTVKRSDGVIAARPAAGRIGGEGEARGETFVMTVVNKELAESVKEVRLGFMSRQVNAADRAPRTVLAFMEMTTAPGDRVRYWLIEQDVRATLPTAVFEPEKAGIGN